jgi:hypothetical protein
MDYPLHDLYDKVVERVERPPFDLRSRRPAATS